MLRVRVCGLARRFWNLSQGHSYCSYFPVSSVVSVALFRWPFLQHLIGQQGLV